MGEENGLEMRDVPLAGKKNGKPLSSSRTAFLSDSMASIQYERKGGYFVSTTKIVVIGFIFALVLVAVGLLVHYFGKGPATAISRTSAEGQTEEAVNELFENGTISSGPPAVRLSPHVRPFLYELYLKPWIGEDTNFSYIGHVAITLRFEAPPDVAPPNSIMLHSKGLNISTDEVVLMLEDRNNSPVAPLPLSQETPGSPMEESNDTTTLTPVESTTQGKESSPSPPPPPPPKKPADLPPPPPPLAGGPHPPPPPPQAEEPPQVNVAGHSFDQSQDTYTVKLDKPLARGVNYVLQIPFSGKIRDDLAGFYRSYYSEPNSKRRIWLATTQFEATDARTAFPCFDEPAMKARFKISIEHSYKYVALSNMPIMSSEQTAAGWTHDHFDVSPEMSTYLLAFIISEMGIVSGNNTAAPPPPPSPPLRPATLPATLIQSTTAGPVTESTVPNIPAIISSTNTIPGSVTPEGPFPTDVEMSEGPINRTVGGNMSSAFTFRGNNSATTSLFGSTTTKRVVGANDTSGGASTTVTTAAAGTGDVSAAENSTAATPSVPLNVTSRSTPTRPGKTTPDDGKLTPDDGKLTPGDGKTTERTMSSTTVRSPVSVKLPGVNKTTATTPEGREVTRRPGKTTELEDDTVTRYEDVSEKTKVPKKLNDTEKPSTTGGNSATPVLPIPQRLRLKRSETIKGKSVPVRMVVRPHLAAQASYAIQITTPLLDFYGEYFGVPYDLPKMDLAAVPDFKAGAMENWGLVTFRETAVLVGPETSVSSKENIAMTIAHELSHQWFGDLVTPDWWNDLWLNEGFATYVQYMGTNLVEPSWRMLDKVVVDEMYGVMGLDSLRSTHTISHEVNNPAEIDESFDEISYNKGACVIRMLNHSLTEPVFKKGVVEYIKKWKLKNARQDDLWESLSAAVVSAPKDKYVPLPSGATVKEVMDSWTLQSGFPVVNVTRDYVTGNVVMTQTRFIVDGNNTDMEEMWHIPVSYATLSEFRSSSTSTQPRVWLTKAEKQKTIEKVLPPGAPGSNEWLLVNLEHTGYFRVNYDQANWELLIRQLQTAPLLIPSTSRAELISDSLALARAGMLSYATALNLTRYLRDNPVKEDDLIPWTAFLDSTGHIVRGLKLSPAYRPLKAYMISVLSPLLKRLGMQNRPDDPQPTKLLRSRVISKLAYLEDHEVVAWAKSLFSAWMNSTENRIPVDVRSYVLCVGVAQGDVDEFNVVLERFKQSENDPTVQNQLLATLACTRQPDLISMLLNTSLDGTTIRLQSSYIVWSSLSSNPVANTYAFDYMRENWNNLVKRFPDSSFPTGDVLESSIGGLNTHIQLEDLLQFVSTHANTFRFTASSLEQSIESLKERIAWKSRYEADITTWLNSMSMLKQ